jgi:hypothetical protein
LKSSWLNQATRRKCFALFVLPLVATDPTVAGIHTSVTKMENDFATLRQRYREKHQIRSGGYPVG